MRLYKFGLLEISDLADNLTSFLLESMLKEEGSLGHELGEGMHVVVQYVFFPRARSKGGMAAWPK